MNSKLGPYTLIAKLGEGGMAEVFKAVKSGPAGFEKTVAIKKVLPPYHDRQEILSMFVSEAKIHSELNHPKLINLIDFFETDKSMVLVMEYFRSKSLHQIMLDAKKKHVQVPWQVAIHICLEVLEALHYAHLKKNSQGKTLHIVHRDISPQNILISEEGLVKLADFGIALANIERDKTGSGAFKGKVRYLSPEQIREKKADHRSDLFSLSVVLYELLFGAHPFEAKPDFEIMEKIVSQETGIPSHNHAGIPNQVFDILIKALIKNPNERFQSAFEFRRSLIDVQDTRWLTHGPQFFQTFLSSLYAPGTLHNESELRGTLVLAPEKKSSTYAILILLLLISTSLGIGYWWPKPPETKTSHVKKMTTALIFEGDAGTAVSINGKKVGVLPIDQYILKPGTYVVMMTTISGQKTLHKIKLVEGQTLLLRGKS